LDEYQYCKYDVLTIIKIINGTKQSIGKNTKYMLLKKPVSIQRNTPQTSSKETEKPPAKKPLVIARKNRLLLLLGNSDDLNCHAMANKQANPKITKKIINNHWVREIFV